MADQVGLKEKRDQFDLNQYPEDLKEEYSFLSSWIRELSQRYGYQILIKVIDAQSFQGFYKSLRHGIHKYPTFIINQKKKYTGKDKVQLESLLQEELANA
jgi:hypothetical protein